MKEELLPLGYNGDKIRVYNVANGDIKEVGIAEFKKSLATKNEIALDEHSSIYYNGSVEDDSIKSITYINYNINRGIFTVLKQITDGTIVLNEQGKAFKITDEQEEQLIQENKLNNLKVYKGYLTKRHYGDREKLPDYLKDILNDDWIPKVDVAGQVSSGSIEEKVDDSKKEIADELKSNDNQLINNSGLGKNESEIIDDKTKHIIDCYDSIESDVDNTDNKSDEQAELNQSTIESNEYQTNVVTEDKTSDVATTDNNALDMQNKDELISEFEVTDENKTEICITNCNYVDFYRNVLNNCEIGDIISIPHDILADFKYEVIKVLDSNMSGTRMVYMAKMKINTDNMLIGTISINEDENKHKFQVQYKTGKKDSINVTQLESNYFRWKQERKYLSKD